MMRGSSASSVRAPSAANGMPVTAIDRRRAPVDLAPPHRDAGQIGENAGDGHDRHGLLRPEGKGQDRHQDGRAAEADNAAERSCRHPKLRIASQIMRGSPIPWHGCRRGASE